VSGNRQVAPTKKTKKGTAVSNFYQKKHAGTSLAPAAGLIDDI
jgi:hypothetical protein